MDWNRAQVTFSDTKIGRKLHRPESTVTPNIELFWPLRSNLPPVYLLVQSTWPHSLFIIGWWYSNPEQRICGTLHSVPLKFKVTMCCPPQLPARWISKSQSSTPLHSALLRSTPLHSAPLDPLAPRDASSPVPLTVPSVMGSTTYYLSRVKAVSP